MKDIQEDEEIRVLGGSHWNEKRKETVSGSTGDVHKKNSFSYKRKRILYLLSSLAVIGLSVFLFYTLILEKHFYGFEYPITRQQEEVLASLKNKSEAQQTGVTYCSDSYLGVDLKLYKIEGLKAELTDKLPSLEDKDLYFVTRSADFRFKGEEQQIIGDYIVDGELVSKNNWRAGYFAILKGNVEIGIGRRSDMRDYLLEHHGSMFRQLALVSAGVKCISQYMLKGKVTRCAYARTVNNDLYFVETVHPETLYGFSDALIEFGFVDAVYVTGGSQPDCFYRDTTGVAHGDYTDQRVLRRVVWRKF